MSGLPWSWDTIAVTCFAAVSAVVGFRALLRIWFIVREHRPHHLATRFILRELYNGIHLDRVPEPSPEPSPLLPRSASDELNQAMTNLAAALDNWQPIPTVPTRDIYITANVEGQDTTLRLFDASAVTMEKGLRDIVRAMQLTGEDDLEITVRKFTGNKPRTRMSGDERQLRRVRIRPPVKGRRGHHDSSSPSLPSAQYTEHEQSHIDCEGFP